MTPAEITNSLGLQAHFAYPVGVPRKTPKGTLLGGEYKDTRWRHCIRHLLTDQRFADKVAAFVDRLLPHKEFFHRVRATSGHAQLIVKFLGDGYLGDTMPLETLAKIADMQLGLGIECFTVPQD